MNKKLWVSAAATLLLAGLAGCSKKQVTQSYEAVPVERRNLVVSASASGAIEPVLTVDVKSKASGEIIGMNVQTGDDVKEDQLLASIDPRIPRNNLAQSQANLEVAQAQLSNAKAQLARSDTLFKAQAITQTEYDGARLDYANANASVIRARSDLENARDRMNDTKLRAPLAGTIITKNVELGTVISSPTTDVGGGTVLFKMANLDTVQIRALVDETDIGKVSPGLLTTITVDAYPNRPFEGTVLKVEPQATVQQNVTMFNVLVRIPNPNHLLKPGMNTEVEIHVGRRDNVLAVPNAALRTQRDVASAAQVLGLDPDDVQQQLAAARQQAPVNRDSASLGGGGTPGSRDSAHAQASVAGGLVIRLPDGRTIPAPAGFTAAQVKLAQNAMDKRMQGQTPSDEEQTAGRALFAALRASGALGGAGGGAGPGGGGFRRNTSEPSSYIVFTLKHGKPTPVQIRTGLTDLDYIEVVSGLTEQDTVLVLPSASLLNAQRDMQQRMRSVTGGGLPGVQQQPATPPRQQATPARP
ncbi:MAG TPA: efflux RND transporter periplasmic adaptor subunit [Gemmatimonadales bacterium]|nr:efflux RND transporter periplasmic adaptor subunit [Gemmatimonadales bacterium]